jgi:hypothetical protein
MEDSHHNVQQEEFHSQALALVTAVEKLLRLKGKLKFSADPVVVRRKIVQFSKRMRVDGLEKFGERTVFSAVNFYINKIRMEEHQALGGIIIYVPVSYISRLLHMMEYPRVDEDDEAAVLDGCGTVANLIAGYFVKELKGQGYVHLEMSHFESFINTSLNGIEFSAEQEWKYEISFEVDGSKKMVAELTLGHIPRY